MDNLDWTLIPAFLAVADTGSLSAAARAARISQPTLGRHIRALEAATGSALFARHPRGLELTEAGLSLLPAARAMAEAANRLALVASGQTEALAGTVRITASHVMAHYLLPPIIADIRAAEPEVQIELVASDASDNLLYREADIAVRMYRPTQLDLIALHLGDTELGLFASHDYLAARGEPNGFADMGDHDLVGYDRDEMILQGMRALGVEARREDFPTRCDNQPVYWELVRAGCGIGAGQVVIAARDPSVRRVLEDLRIDPLPVWLTAHERLRHTPRVSRVWGLLSDRLRVAIR